MVPVLFLETSSHNPTTQQPNHDRYLGLDVAMAIGTFMAFNLRSNGNVPGQAEIVP